MTCMKKPHVIEPLIPLALDLSEPYSILTIYGQWQICIITTFIEERCKQTF